MRFEQETLLEMVVYIIEKTKGIDYYRLFKILYFAERKFLTKWGRKLVHDDFFALPYGPVPTMLFDVVKGKGDQEFACRFWESVRRAGEEANNTLLARRSADMDYIAQAQQAILDESIEEYATKSFNELLEASHQSDWKTAFDRSSKKIEPTEIALSAGADMAMVAYIQEQLEWDNAMS